MSGSSAFVGVTILGGPESSLTCAQGSWFAQCPPVWCWRHKFDFNYRKGSLILIKKKCPISRVTKRGIGIKNGPFISPFYGGFFRFAFLQAIMENFRLCRHLHGIVIHTHFYFY